MTNFGKVNKLVQTLNAKFTTPREKVEFLRNMIRQAPDKGKAEESEKRLNEILKSKFGE